MITFNIDYNNRLMDYIFVAHWSYYRENGELTTRIFNILQDLTQGSARVNPGRPLFLPTHIHVRQESGKKPQRPYFFDVRAVFIPKLNNE